MLDGATRRLGCRVSHLRELGETALAPAPEEQYLVATGRTYFRDLSFDDLHRMQFDLETTGLNPDRDRIFMVAVRDPSGATDTLEAPCEGNADEAALIRELVAKMTAADPDVIENSLRSIQGAVATRALLGWASGTWAARLDFSLLFAHSGVVSSTCRVSFTDAADVTHTVIVSASSLYEAAILGIAEFKRSGIAFGGISGATRIKIAVQPPAITHELSVAKVQAWLETNGKTPREQAQKVTLRQVLSRS